MLPFSSKNLKQADLIRHEKNITDDIWQKRRNHISDEHRQSDARLQLETAWKEWI
jgi:hypothetical protein